MYWQNLVWRSLGHVISQHAASCWFRLHWNTYYTKTTMVTVFKAYTEWYWSIHTFEKQNRCSLPSSKLQAKAEFTETCPLVTCCPAILSFQTGMNATLLNHMGLGVCGLLQSLQLRSGVGCNIVSPVAFQCGAVSKKFYPLAFQCTLQILAQWYHSVRWVNQWHSSVHWTSQSTLAQG